MEPLAEDMILAEMALNLLGHELKLLIIMKNIYLLIVFINRPSPGPILWRLRSIITKIFTLLCVDLLIS